MQARFQADIAPAAAVRVQVAAERVQMALGSLGRAKAGQPAIAQLSHATQNGIRMTAEPDGNRPLYGQRVDSGVRDVVPAAAEGDEFVGP